MWGSPIRLKSQKFFTLNDIPSFLSFKSSFMCLIYKDPSINDQECDHRSLEGKYRRVLEREMTCKLSLYRILWIDDIPSNTLLTFQILPPSNRSGFFAIIHANDVIYWVCAFSVISCSQFSGLLKDKRNKYKSW